MMGNIKPKFSAPSEEDIQQVHETALTILEKTGIRVDDSNAEPGEMARQGLPNGRINFKKTYRKADERS